MATYMTLLLLLMAVLLISSTSSATTIPPRNPDLLTAIEEMQKANYFTFVLLINMAPADLIQGNLTFLMPNDRTLSKTVMPENAVADFLLRHSIPSPLLFDHLQHIPTGSTIPTSKPEFMLKISNNGRRQFFLNNVRIISPNICTLGPSIRCHGIDGVLMSGPTLPEHNSTLPSPTCSTNGRSLPPTPWPMPPTGGGLAPLAAPPPSGPNASPQKSGCSSRKLPRGGLFEFLITCMLLAVMFSI